MCVWRGPVQTAAPLSRRPDGVEGGEEGCTAEGRCGDQCKKKTKNKIKSESTSVAVETSAWAGLVSRSGPGPDSAPLWVRSLVLARP